MTIPIKKWKDRDTEENVVNDGLRSWNNVTTYQSIPRIAGSYQKVIDRHGMDSPSEN
jgi:hypothetical protein